MSMRRKLAAAVAGLAVAGGTLVALAPSPAAAAATPQCTRRAEIRPDPGFWTVGVPVSSGGSMSCWMQRGNYSSGVRALQLALRDCYHQAIGVDNDFGPETERALRRAQEQLHIRVDGQYGPQTAGAIWFSGAETSNPNGCQWGAN